MIEAWRSQIIMQLQAEGLLSLEAAARVDLYDPDDSGSPLIECVVEGELSASSLVEAVLQVTGRPRLDWTLVPWRAIRDSFGNVRDLCLRYRVVPLRVVAGSHVDLAMVDPSWGAAHQAFRAVFGLPLRVFVIGYTDFIFITRPELAPPLPVVEDEVDTISASPSEEVVELLRAFEQMSSAPAQEPASPLSTLEIEGGELPSSRSAGRPAFRIDGLESHGLALREGEEPYRSSAASRSSLEGSIVRDRDTGESSAPLPPAASKPVILSPSGPPMRSSWMDARVNTASPVKALRMVTSVRANADRVLSEMLHTILEDTSSPRVWDELFDCFSLVARGSARGVVRGDELVLLQARMDGSVFGFSLGELIADMALRSIPSVMSKSRGAAIFSLVASTRQERALMAYCGESSLVIVDVNDEGAHSMLGMVGLADEHRDFVREALLMVAEHSDLLKRQGIEGRP